MGIIKSIVEKHQNNIQEKNQLCEDLLTRSNMALEKANTMFTDKKSFIDPLLGDDWQIENKSLLQELRHNNLKSLKRTSRYNDLLSNQCRLQNFSEKCFDIIHEHNEEVVDIVDLLLDENNDEPISLFDENEKEIKFEQVAIIPESERIYAILKPIDEMEGVADDEAIVFVVDYDEDGNSFLTVETNEEIAIKVFDKYYQLLDEAEGKENQDNK